MPKTIVIGGGIAGLYYAHLWTKTSSTTSDTLEIWDKATEAGGRLRSVYDEHGGLSYEAGAWRIAPQHRRLRALCSELNCTLDSAPQRMTYIDRHMPVAISSCADLSGISRFDCDLVTGATVLETLSRDLETGYMDEMHRPHVASSGPPLPTGQVWSYPQNGFTSLANALKMRILNHASVEWKPGRLVLDVDPRSRCIVWRETAADDETMPCTTCLEDQDRIVVACPPIFTREWLRFFEATRLSHACVEATPLCRIYMPLRKPMERHDLHAVLPYSRLQQVSSTPGKKHVQISYSAGPLARHWHRLSLSPTRLKAELKREWDSLDTKDVMQSVDIDWEGSDPLVYYWDHGVHRFRPGFGFDKHAVTRAALYPVPDAEEYLCRIGEAFSGYQGWCEGALQTAELALSYKPPPPPLPRRPSLLPRTQTYESMCINGRIIPIHDWLSRHPGGAKAIENHLRDKDALRAMLRVGHSQYAFAIAFYMDSLYRTSSHDNMVKYTH